MKEVPVSSLPAPVVILVRPQLAENVGMVARAMMNCGLSELRVVNPRESPFSKKAKSASSGAGLILKQSKIFDTLEAALSDINYAFATTARGRDMEKPLMVPEKAIQTTDRAIRMGEKVAWVFGPERTGLENEDLALSDALVQIPLNPVHSSLNLSQAVLVMGYTWWIRHVKPLKEKPCHVATKQELKCFLTHLDDLLTAKGYYAFPEKQTRMRRNLHNIFERNALTSSEIKTLYNVLSKLS